jgi:hypothetical protein
MSTCTRCGATFSCAMVDTAPAAATSAPVQPCWCTLLPAAVAVPSAPVGCWCPACLAQHLAAHPVPGAKPGSN